MFMQCKSVHDDKCITMMNSLSSGIFLQKDIKMANKRQHM